MAVMWKNFKMAHIIQAVDMVEQKALDTEAELEKQITVFWN
jgi:hypothetical protein